jgi:peptidyl-prolyl cis-trans isomerase B (cyclophilin B)
MTTPGIPPQTRGRAGDFRPSYAWPILLGFLGAWIAHAKIRRSGSTASTSRYWVAATISTVVGLAASILLPLGVLLVIALNVPDNSPSAAPDSSSHTQGTTSGQATSSPPTSAIPVAGCVPPPEIPTDKRSGTLPDKKTAAGKTFIATINTNCGVITMELDGTRAPQTVASFLGLAKSGYWVDSPCHRLTTEGIFVLQCGDPTGTGGGNPGYSYGVENAPANFAYPAGTLAMARTSDPRSNGGQFFIVYKDTVLQDTVGYSIFGRITSGMDIVEKIVAAGATPPDANQNTAPVQPISILKVDVAEKKSQ